MLPVLILVITTNKIASSSCDVKRHCRNDHRPRRSTFLDALTLPVYTAQTRKLQALTGKSRRKMAGFGWLGCFYREPAAR
jgi:hypothetical protein